MSLPLILLLLHLCFLPTTMIPMTVYNNAWFDPIDNSFFLMKSSLVTTQTACQCQCYNNPMCLTAIYIGLNQTCFLFSASLLLGELRIIINQLASVSTFPNKKISTRSVDPPSIIQWLFDGDFDDVYNQCDGQNPNNTSPTRSIWISPGYNGHGSAVYFPANTYSVVNHFLDLTATSFALSAWIWIPFNFTSAPAWYFSLFSQCQATSPEKCLHMVINTGRLYWGFYADDLTGATVLSSNKWYHVAYVYDRSGNKQLVFLNGNLDNTRSPTGNYSANASQLILGSVPLFTVPPFQYGYIDQLTFVTRVKNASELLNEATLVAYYAFDGSYLDSGPNNINTSSALSTNFSSNGQSNQALMFASGNVSYFQVTGFYYLGQSNYSYSFSLWIYPFSSQGTILQVNSSNGWCVPMIGFSQKGSLTAQTVGVRGVCAISSSASSLNQWTHVAMTYSLTNGIRLYVGGSMVGSNSASSDYLASGNTTTITVGAGLPSCTSLVKQSTIIISQYHGMIDEWKIFSRELSASVVKQLAG